MPPTWKVEFPNPNPCPEANHHGVADAKVKVLLEIQNPNRCPAAKQQGAADAQVKISNKNPGWKSTQDPEIMEIL